MTAPQGTTTFVLSSAKETADAEHREAHPCPVSGFTTTSSMVPMSCFCMFSMWLPTIFVPRRNPLYGGQAAGLDIGVADGVAVGAANATVVSPSERAADISVANKRLGFALILIMGTT